MKKIITLFILLSAVMSGCSKAEEEPKEPAIFTNAVKNTAEASEDIKKIKSSGDVLYGLYSNNFLSSANITSFSNKVPNVEIYSIETDIYSPFPSEFVLKCYSEGKTPLITIKYGTSAPDMAKFASLAGELDIPIILDIFPCYGIQNYREYTENFTLFCQLIKKYAPNAQIVWSFCPDTETDPNLYQGKTYVDYIGLICYIQNPYDNMEQLSSLKNACEKFKYEKPIILTRFAVSHFNSNDHTYKTEGAEKFIEYFYKDFILEYPQIKAVVYANSDVNEANYLYFERSDYSLTSEPELLSKFVEIIE